MTLMDGQNQHPDTQGGHEEFRPGDTISPRSHGTTAPPTAPMPIAQAAATFNTPPREPSVEAEAQYAQPGDEAEVVWTASEFIAHHKSAGWYLGLVGATVAGSLLGFLITRDWFTVGVVILCAILFGVSASRQPRQLEYAIDGAGLYVAQKFYPFSHFRSFSIVDEANFSSIAFMPLKRFSPPLSIFYDLDQEHDIVTALSRHLPMSEPKRDVIDGLMRRIRF